MTKPLLKAKIFRLRNNMKPRFPIHLLSRDNQIALFKKAYELRKDFWLDILDCSISLARQKVHDATFEDALGYFNSDSISTMILRDSDDFLLGMKLKYFEIGFRSMGRNVDHFLYIIVDYDEYQQELIEYYCNLGGVVLCQ